MRIRIQVGAKAEERGWNTVKIFGIIVVLSALVSSSSRAVVKPSQPVPKTVIPAVIRAGQMDTLTVPFGARVVQVLVAPGAGVKAGQLLAVLESDDVQRRIESAERRVAIAESRTRAGGRRKLNAVGQLQVRTAARSLELAKKRLAGDSLATAESAWTAARQRKETLESLVSRQMATAAELAAAQREEQNELRNLRAAEEHHSRLQQEVEAFETQLAVFESQADVSVPGEPAAAAAELADARAMLEEALRHQQDLQVKAPHDGIVLSSVPSPGDPIYAGAAILQIADIGRLSFESAVSATVARAIRPGVPVRLRVPTEPPRQVDAEVSSVALAPDPIQQSYVVRAVIANPDRNVILVGMEGAMEFRHSENLWQRLF